jgi:SAM-dependent methyltransferase
MTKPLTMNGLPAEEWAGAMGDRWLANLDRLEGMIAPIGEALMTRAGFRSGEHVVDVGCGAGGTSIDIALQVEPQGSVLGIDISPRLIEAAVRRSQDAKLGNIRFRCADAASAHADGPLCDRLFSRFGLMFFADAPAAFANLHTLLRAGGRVDFSVWTPARDNAWVAQMMAIIAQYVELPAPVRRAPGPFALDDPLYVRQLLEHGGFEAIQIDVWKGDQLIAGAGASPGEATDFVFEAMSFGKLLEDASPEICSRVRGELTGLFARHHRAEGVRMAASAFLVSAAA